ncbi:MULTISPECIES: hypothetical protein [unclassified Streptomyces]|uniref:hypothetical protein n=1 Tax=unclassified Streptomyces TaxID=2593676 RepID=UPI0020255598|nr:MULTISPECIES: hypothetical protein [unclassified Streptomyces]MCX4550541.1 hypothetical protein [Streptomyces sp. NBC_01500]WSC21988.1 hypothetical protein OIE60_21170 [Streptomyces sp. NBC_01766]
MPSLRRKPASDALPTGGLLDWSDSAHYSTDPRLCRHCGVPTHLRDGQGRPAHKVCAERVLAQVMQVVETYSTQERL